VKGCLEAQHPNPFVWLVRESVRDLVHSLDRSLVAVIELIPPPGVVRIQEFVEGFVKLAATATRRSRRGAIIDHIDDNNPVLQLAQSVNDVVQSPRPVPGRVLSPRGQYQRQLPPIATKEARLAVVLPNPGPLEQRMIGGGHRRPVGACPGETRGGNSNDGSSSGQERNVFMYYVHSNECLPVKHRTHSVFSKYRNPSSVGNSGGIRPECAT
jgi:hypothetical protein